MERAQFTDQINFDNILYIGEEPKACLSVLMDFNERLKEIEYLHEDWFSRRNAKGRPTQHDRLQYHIHYNFEGGIAIFKFKDDELPHSIREECTNACRDLAEEQLYYAS